MAEAPFPACTGHLAKRIRDKQWIEETTEQDYLDDLRQAVRDDDAHLVVYRRRGGNLAAVLTETTRIIEGHRLGANWDPLFFVVYSADPGIILSGYQANSLNPIALPEDVRWLT
jgi:hypothetical protein